MHACRDYLRESARGQRLYYLGGLLTVTIVTLRNHQCSPEGRRRRPVNNVREGFSPESNSVRRLKQTRDLFEEKQGTMHDMDDKRVPLGNSKENSAEALVTRESVGTSRPAL